MTLFLDTAMTFVMISLNTGWDQGFSYRFFNSWLIGFIVAFPTSLLTIPVVSKLADKLVKD
jgi:hypothetical protein